MKIVGEPVERLSLWGHTASCVFPPGEQRSPQILVFGGFGGSGRHARRNDALLLDPQSGLLKQIGPVSSPCPSPRLGHTASVVGDRCFVIGGRTGPTGILNEVWVLDLGDCSWTLLHCTGASFHPRHRHAAAVVGSDIYVFGGLNNEYIYSSMHILNTKTLQWCEVNIYGECPSACHSHSLIARGPYLFMFGGYDGERALGDLYSFDTQTFSFKKVQPVGKTPLPRFSHSMFVYKNYLGVIGGCPLRQERQEIALFDLIHHVWKHVTVDSVGREIWIRSSVNVVNDDLLIVGGGVSCYAFGTKFDPPMKICLLLVTTVKSYSDNRHVMQCDGSPVKMNNAFSGHLNCAPPTKKKETPYGRPEETQAHGYHLEINESKEGVGQEMEPKHMTLQLERKYAKLGKDILKRFGWLDLGRKVESSEDGHHIFLPVTHAFFGQRALYLVEKTDSIDASLGLPANEISLPKAIGLLLSCGVLTSRKPSIKRIPRSPHKLMIDAVGSLIDSKGIPQQLLEQLPTRKPNIKRNPRSPHKLMIDAVGSLIDSIGIPRQLLKQLPTRWEHLGDIVVLPVTSFKDPIWDSIAEELWPVVAKSLGALRLARQGRVSSTGTRDSTLEILLGASGWVDHRENGIIYSFDATKCMFSSGNLSEKRRMAQLDCRNEIVVDLFAGIGYFVLPFLVKSKAKLVYACEWNPYALKALRCNVQANVVADRCIILEGDNRVTAPKGIADRVCLGLLPTSEDSWPTAVQALKTEGGILHVHGNVNDVDERSWSEYVVKSIQNMAKLEGHCWDVSIEHLERVKWYGPHIRHLVADIRCKQQC